jgi:5-(carboxyamino)imidazole ribonucleotide synthase
MVNILGEHVQNVLEKLTDLPNWKVHLYGKNEAKFKRKMGHITILCDSVETAIEEVEVSSIWEEKSLEAKR